MDDLGRIVIPVGIRRSLGIGEGDPLEFAVDRDVILLRRPTDLCVFCGQDDGTLVALHGRHACRSCLDAANHHADEAGDAAHTPAGDTPAAVVPAVAHLPVDRAGAPSAQRVSAPASVPPAALSAGRGFEERYRLPDASGATTAW